MLIHFEIRVNVARKTQRGVEADGAEREEEDVANEKRVAEELNALQEAGHLRAVVEVEDGVEEDEDAGGTRREHRLPPPAVVLAAQLKVGEHDGDASSHADHNEEDDQQDAVQCVRLSAPQRGEYVVEFDRNRAERQETADKHAQREKVVPGDSRNLAGDVLRPARRLERLGVVSAGDAADDCQREPNQQPDEHEEEDGGERQCLR